MDRALYFLGGLILALLVVDLLERRQADWIAAGAPAERATAVPDPVSPDVPTPDARTSTPASVSQRKVSSASGRVEGGRPARVSKGSGDASAKAPESREQARLAAAWTLAHRPENPLGTAELTLVGEGK